MVLGLPLGGTTRARTRCSSLLVSASRRVPASAFVVFIRFLVSFPSAGTRDWCAPRGRLTRGPRSHWAKCPRSVSEPVEQVDGPPAGDEADRDSRNQRDRKRVEYCHHVSSKRVLVCAPTSHRRETQQGPCQPAPLRRTWRSTIARGNTLQ